MLRSSSNMSFIHPLITDTTVLIFGTDDVCMMWLEICESRHQQLIMCTLLVMMLTVVMTWVPDFIRCFNFYQVQKSPEKFVFADECRVRLKQVQCAASKSLLSFILHFYWVGVVVDLDSCVTDDSKQSWVKRVIIFFLGFSVWVVYTSWINVT